MSKNAHLYETNPNFLHGTECDDAIQLAFTLGKGAVTRREHAERFVTCTEYILMVRRDVSSLLRRLEGPCEGQWERSSE